MLLKTKCAFFIKQHKHTKHRQQLILAQKANTDGGAVVVTSSSSYYFMADRRHKLHYRHLSPGWMSCIERPAVFSICSTKKYIHL